jgi:hypothetical protein
MRFPLSGAGLRDHRLMTVATLNSRTARIMRQLGSMRHGKLFSSYDQVSAGPRRVGPPRAGPAHAAPPHAGPPRSGRRRGDPPRAHPALGRQAPGIVGAILLFSILLGGCASKSEPPPLPEAFIARNTVEISKELLPNAPVVATLKLGTRVEIAGRRRRFVKVRTTSGVEGWTQDSKLITPDIRDLMRQLSDQTAADPAQGTVHALQTLNVHLEPQRWSPTIYQLQEDEGAQLLRHQVNQRLPNPPEPGKPPPPPTGLDDWYLLRLANGQPGWVLTTGVYSGIPDEVKQYAERRRVIAYFPLGEVEDRSGNAKKTWLWTQIGRAKQQHDFDLYRVFMWSRNRGVYQTIRLERGLTGYLPVVFHPKLETKRGTGPGFSITVERKGKRTSRTYVLIKYRVYPVGEEPGPPAPASIRLNRKVKKIEQPPTMLDRVRNWWKKQSAIWG